MKYDGIFFDSGGTIFDAGPRDGGTDPDSASVEAGGPPRAVEALRWLGHEVKDEAVVHYLSQLKHTLPSRLSPAYTQENLIEALFEALDLAPKMEEIVYVTGVYSGPRYRSWVFSHVHEVLEVLHKTGIPMGLIANTHVPDWIMDRNFRGVDLIRYFGVRLYSGDEGFAKPDTGLFRLAEARSGLQGKKLIYMGNSVKADIQGARHAGWSSILFRSSEKSSEGLADFEIDSWQELPQIVR
jgi:FMN phosphatase YigB (HAD superfamily)